MFLNFWVSKGVLGKWHRLSQGRGGSKMVRKFKNYFLNGPLPSMDCFIHIPERTKEVTITVIQRILEKQLCFGSTTLLNPWMLLVEQNSNTYFRNSFIKDIWKSKFYPDSFNFICLFWRTCNCIVLKPSNNQKNRLIKAVT